MRLNATMTQNVVTYTVEIVTDNRSWKLLPYLTANVRFTMDRRDDVLAVPNAALRWSPPGPSHVAVRARATGDRADRMRSSGPARGESPRVAGRAIGPRRRTPRSRGTVWVLDQGQLQPVAVRAGLTRRHDHRGRGRRPPRGRQVVVGEQVAGGAPGPEASNPFAPHDSVRRRRRTAALTAGRRTHHGHRPLIKLEEIRRTFHLGEIDVPVAAGHLARRSTAASWSRSSGRPARARAR